jgi:SRSO17 transposase
MAEIIVQNHERLSSYLSAFRGVFRNRAQYRHFQGYILGFMIYLGSRNLAGLSRAIPNGKSASSLYRFVAKIDWDAQQVEQVGRELLN